MPRDPKKDKPSSSGFASAVVIFDASWQGEHRPEARLRRDNLITTGQIILDMINCQAVELTLAADQVIRNTTHKLAPAVIQEQPAVATPSAWEPPVAGDNATNAAAAAELAMLEQVSPVGERTKLTEMGYADACLIMEKQLECVDLSKEQQATVRGYVKGWLDEPYPLSEIFYRLDLAVANLLAGQPIHQGFAMEDNRAPTLPHWQRHPAVKGVIYQIDDADILTPAKTAELAAWIIDNLTAPDDLLALAIAKAAELLAQSAEATNFEPNHSELQLELLDAHQPTEEPSTKSLEDWAFDYQNNELNLGGAEWSCFVAVLTVLYGIKEHYSTREVAIAISVSDEQLMDEYTTLDGETKDLLRKVVSMLKQVEGFNFTETCPVLDPHRQEAVIALLNALHKEPDLSPITQRSVMINTITRMYEVVA
ncbi:hypothetical protein D3C79_561670 [compost metagenome]